MKKVKISNQKKRYKRIKKYKERKIIIYKYNSYICKLIIIIFLLILCIFGKIFYDSHFVIYNNVVNKNNKKTKVCMCSIAKKENLYVKFFVEHYKKLGYDHMFIYDNNDINDEKIEDVIKDYIDQEYVTVIDYRGYSGNRNAPQFDANYDCYEKNYKNYDWFSFFDIDEYLVLKPEGIKIQEFLNNERYNNCIGVKFHWKMFNDNDKTEYENKPLIERFTIKSKCLDTATTVKSIIRGNLPLNRLERTYGSHTIYRNIKHCTSSGEKTGVTYYHYPPDYKYAELRHYTKTVREYINKIKRGIPTTKLIINRQSLRDFFNGFFCYNNKTPEKVKIFNDAFDTNFQL